MGCLFKKLLWIGQGYLSHSEPLNATFCLICCLFISENMQLNSVQRCFFPGKASCQVPLRESIWGILGSPLISVAWHIQLQNRPHRWIKCQQKETHERRQLIEILTEITVSNISRPALMPTGGEPLVFEP